MEFIGRMPLAQGIDPAAGLGRFIVGAKFVQAEVLVACDDSGRTSLASERWQVGWDVSLHKSFRKALSSSQVRTPDLLSIIDGFFTTMR